MEVAVSLHSARTEVARLQGELADINKRIASETGKLAEILRRQNDVQRSMQYKMSPSQLSFKLSELERLTKDQANIQKNQSELEKKSSQKKIEIARCQERLGREESNEQKRHDDAEKKRRMEQEKYIKKTKESLRKFAKDSHIYDAVDAMDYDVFISHASEDKEGFVRPLAEDLRGRNVKVWYDEFSLGWGASLRRSIDVGLARSRFGIVVLSEFFFKKEWTQRELDGLFALEMDGRSRILPIWHKISKDEVRKFSPLLADKLALNSAMHDVSEISSRLSEMLKSDNRE
jgi:hypothetical protein